MSARGDAARRRRWADRDAAKDYDRLQLEATLEAWLVALPEDKFVRLEEGITAIFGYRYRHGPLNSTPDERDAVVALIKQINHDLDAGHVEVDPSPGQKETSMSIEKAIADLTAAVEANTAALKAGGTAKPSTAKEKAKDADDVKKPTKTRDELAAILGKVKEEKGAETAKGLIKEVGKTAKLVDVADENIDALFAAAEKALAEEGL